MRALSALGEHAKEHAGAIAARLEDDVWGVRQAAEDALFVLHRYSDDDDEESTDDDDDDEADSRERSD